MKPRDWANDFSTNAVNLEVQEVKDTNTDVWVNSRQLVKGSKSVSEGMIIDIKQTIKLSTAFVHNYFLSWPLKHLSVSQATHLISGVWMWKK